MDLRDIIKKTELVLVRDGVLPTPTEEFLDEVSVAKSIISEFQDAIKERKVEINRRLQELDGQPEHLLLYKEQLKEGDPALCSHEEQLNNAIEDYRAAKKIVATVIKKIPNALQRQILKLHYYDLLDWSKIAESLGLSIAQVNSLHKDGLIEAQKIIEKEQYSVPHPHEYPVDTTLMKT